MNLDPSMMSPEMQAAFQAAIASASKELERARIPYAVALALVVWEAPMVTFLAVAALLGTRVYAVWQQSKIILAILLSLAGLEFGVQVAAFVHAKAVQLPPPVRACLPDASSQHLLWGYISTVLLLDTVVLVLSLIKTLSRDGARSKVASVLVRDQIVFFALCFAVELSNIIVFALTDANKNRSVMMPIAVAISSIAANRMLLNLRGAAEETTSVLASTASYPLSFQKSQQVSVTMPPHRPIEPVYAGFYDERKGRSVETLRQ